MTAVGNDSGVRAHGLTMAVSGATLLGGQRVVRHGRQGRGRHVFRRQTKRSPCVQGRAIFSPHDGRAAAKGIAVHSFAGRRPDGAPTVTLATERLEGRGLPAVCGLRTSGRRSLATIC